MKKLSRDFYMQPTLEVAKGLLGKYLVHHKEGFMMGRIVETEAYIGSVDKACHGYNNKMTKRTQVMFYNGGVAYVYLIYGMYYCFNVVTEKEGEASAVLIRAMEPIEGLEKMVQNRYDRPIKQMPQKQLYNLTSGPGKLCKAMDITKENNGMDLCGEQLYILEGHKNEKNEIIAGTRINVSYAEEAAAFPWRFYIKNNSYVSKA